MSPHTTHASSQRAGSFSLADGKALTLRSASAGVLRVKQGRVWATTQGLLGDHVLVPGSCLQVPARCTVVIESWALQGAGGVLFDWEPAWETAWESAPVRAAASQTPAAQRQALAQALGDLRAALVLAGAAAARLVVGAARLALAALARPVLRALA